LFAPHIYGVVLRAHPVRGEPRIQRNASVEVATLPRITLPDHLWYVYEVTEIFEAWAFGPTFGVTFHFQQQESAWFSYMAFPK